MSAAPGPLAPLGQWLDYISAQHPAKIALGLDRVREVMGRMRLALPATAITVGGTNGKGSTCAYLECILRTAGYRTGLYTSPHLLRYNERVRVDGAEAGDAELARDFARVESARGATPLTYFEFGTLAALAAFERLRVEVAILEVGLGGRLDAVNAVDPDCAIVSSVDLDHQAWLGDDREAIAREKAHIFRPGRPAFFGDADPPASLVAHAQAIGAPLQVLGRDFRAVPRGERQWDFEGRRGARRSLPMPALRGRWQLANAATALAALDELAGRLPVSLGEVKRGLTGVRLAGRLQVLPGRPTVVLDVAHNPHAARALAAGLGEMGFHENTIAVFAMLADKDIGAVIDAVSSRVDRWHVATVPGERAASASRVAGLLAERGLGGRTRVFATVRLAWEAALREAGPDDRILVFGSFLTVAEVLEAAR
ncbi:MAG: bifunctional tetrahydrofolate synthase/dihydrofolate synthase [Betaproteobacteria bacterium]|nr:MAG: bifunctional tetrahydrofolate synthase/dihydrofolate synthase [Betaproteobacteria bacterium]